jgi:Ca2+/Na+ antiporter
MKEVLIVLGQVLKDVFSSSVKFLKNNYKMILNTLYCLILIASKELFKDSIDGVVFNIICFLVLVLLQTTLDRLKSMENVKAIPALKRKLTKVKDNGDVTMSKADINIAIIYLHEIEEYLVKNGYVFKVIVFVLIAVTTIASKSVTAYADELNEEEQILIQQLAIAEAESQGVGGMAFVMQTVLNRVEDEQFPNDVKSVIYQNGQFETATKGLQSIRTTNNSLTALKLINSGKLLNKGQLYFENNYGKAETWHSKNLELIFTHLDHSFYK